MAAFGRQPRLAAGALEEPEAQRLLEAANAQADGGLREVEPRRRRVEAAEARDPVEGFESDLRSRALIGKVLSKMRGYFNLFQSTAAPNLG